MAHWMMPSIDLLAAKEFSFRPAAQSGSLPEDELSEIHP
jgi:hypothetical protein